MFLERPPSTLGLSDLQFFRWFCHAVGNLHTISRSRNFNGYGHFYAVFVFIRTGKILLVFPGSWEFNMEEIIFTILGQKNFVLTKDRVGLSSSAIFLFVFLTIHAVVILHVLLVPKGYGLFLRSLYWTPFGLQANTVEEYVLLNALFHLAVVLKRTCDMSLYYSVASVKLNLAIFGMILLTFTTIHRFQFRFLQQEVEALCVTRLPLSVGTNAVLLGHREAVILCVSLQSAVTPSTR